MTVHPSPALRAPAPAGYPGAAAVIMRSLVCLYLVVVKSAVATVAGPTTVGGIAVVLVSAGLVGVLLKAELETALAHEVAHSANGDGQVVGTALGPVLAATPKRPPWSASVQSRPPRVGAVSRRH